MAGWRDRSSQLKTLLGSLALLGIVLGGCQPTSTPIGPEVMNSRYRDEQPSLSGSGEYVAFVSNRDRRQQIFLYHLTRRQFVQLPRLHQPNAIVESPSISYNARYLVYLSSIRGKPEIVLYDRVTRRQEALTLAYPGWVRNPSLSPDGRYVVFETDRRGQWDVEIIDRGPNVELDMPDGKAIAK
ncbi:TolB family protein [Roseofilum casamattae]|uniref:Biopolymer transporter Tol n=1 Tax=Roseofilum casamattae BLCC-M143 TaxID=3022442 RepID=A0ABT7C2J4_9CYAN|nr:biopolymer transporter Tol [Roseofilum casamattae]MDJ1185669.1 biopolymer transporter Tol [Roseofilum casamattae BLCC-M143]